MSQYDEPAADEPMEVDECSYQDGNDSVVPMEIGTDSDVEDGEEDSGHKVAKMKLCHKCGESNTMVICLDGNWNGCEKRFHISCLDTDDKERANRDGEEWLCKDCISRFAK